MPWLASLLKIHLLLILTPSKASFSWFLQAAYLILLWHVTRNTVLWLVKTSTALNNMPNSVTLKPINNWPMFLYSLYQWQKILSRLVQNHHTQANFLRQKIGSFPKKQKQKLAHMLQALDQVLEMHVSWCLPCYMVTSLGSHLTVCSVK